MFLPKIPQDIESVELISHRRHVSNVILSTVMPVFFLFLFFVASGEAFWLAPCLLFVFVGGMNYFIMNARPVPRYVSLDQAGIRFETREGNRHEYAWTDVIELKEHLRELRGRHRMVLSFKDSSETLSLFPQAMLLTTCDGKTAERLITDRFMMKGVVWDRPMKYVRVILEKNIPSFKA